MTGGGLPRPGDAGDLTVHVATVPNPFLLRGVVADHLAGRPVPAGPEAAVAQAVGRAVVQAVDQAVDQAATTAAGPGREVS